MRFLPLWILLSACAINDPAEETVDEVPYSTRPCPTTYLLTTPPALQCCYTLNTSGYDFTLFIAGDGLNAGKFIQRYGPYAPCKASDKVTACSGTNCYYGPYGFSRPVVYTPAYSINRTEVDPNHYMPWAGRSTEWCWGHSYPTQPDPPAPTFADVNGTLTTYCACCLNGAGRCCGTSCSACSGPPPTGTSPATSEGLGDWDY